MRRSKGFGLLEAVLAIGVLSTLFITGIFLAKESLDVRKIEDTRASLELLVRSFHAYGRIPTDSNEFLDFLNSVLKTDLDPYSRPYVLILAEDVSSDLLNTCFTDSTNLSVRMPYGAVVSNVVAVLLSAGEDGVHDTLGQSYNAPQLIKRQGQIRLNENDLFKVVSLTEFKARNCAIGGPDGYAYSRLFVDQKPTAPHEGDLFYDTRTGKIERYANGSWKEVDWKKVVKASVDWQKGYPNYINVFNDKLYVRSGNNWVEVIPAVGARTIKIMNFDNASASAEGNRPRYLYWVDVGTTVILEGANHLPIVYLVSTHDAVHSVTFRGMYWHSFPYEYWVGLKPSGRRISDGRGHGISGTWYIGGYLTEGLSIVPIFEQANVSENWVEFTLTVRGNYLQFQRWLTTGLGQSHAGYQVMSAVGSGTVPSDSFWLGTFATMGWQECRCVEWYCDDYSYCECVREECTYRGGQIFHINHIVLTRTS